PLTPFVYPDFTQELVRRRPSSCVPRCRGAPGARPLCAWLLGIVMNLAKSRLRRRRLRRIGAGGHRHAAADVTLADVSGARRGGHRDRAGRYHRAARQHLLRNAGPRGRRQAPMRSTPEPSDAMMLLLISLANTGGFSILPKPPIGCSRLPPSTPMAEFGTQRPMTTPR